MDKKIIEYIKNNIDSLSVNERQDILQMIVNSSIEDSRIQTKGDGTQIKFKDLPVILINNIYNYIQVKMNNKLTTLNNFSSEEQNT